MKSHASTAHKTTGFTLLEVLLVVAIIAILAGIVILALNPVKQLGDTRNSERRSDVTTILNAVYQYSLDNDGNLPSGITTSAKVLGTNISGCDTVCTATATAVGCVDLSSALVPTYVVGIPVDPKTGSTTSTDYYIRTDADGRLIVGACDPEQGASIQVTR